jgi:uncharacterized protein YjbI with pentapeptide repeats
MGAEIYEDLVFEGEDFTKKTTEKREFDNCTFINCLFSGAILTDDDFSGCHFRGCDMSLAKMENTGVKKTRFESCRLSGIDFSRCNNFNFSPAFINCPMDYSSFFGRKMKSLVFSGCSLREVDFTEADLSQVNFENCDLARAVFFSTLLVGTDFSTATNYSFDPAKNHLKKTRVSFAGLPGLLEAYDIEIV